MSWTTSSKLDHSVADQSTVFSKLRRSVGQGEGALRERLAAALVEAIQSGDFPAGVRLPSERRFADELGVSRGTVIAAMDQLTNLGTIERRRGSGSYVLRAPVTMERTGTPADRRLVDLWLRHSTPLDLAISSTVEAPTGLLEDLPVTALLTAQPTHGYSAVGEKHMREAAANHLAQQQLPANSDNILITTGAQQALALAIESMVRAGDRVFVEAPTYPGILALIRRAGARPVPLRTDSEGIVPSALEQAIREGGPALLVTVSIASNPTGAVLSPGRRAALLSLVTRHQLVVLEDLTMADLVFADVPVAEPLSAAPEVQGIVVGSASKTLWGGLRVGWLHAPEPWLGQFVQAKALSDFGTSPITQHLAGQMLRRLDDDPTFLLERRRSLRSRKEYLAQLLNERLPAWGVGSPAGGMSLWVRLPGTDARAFADVADQHGVHVMPGDQCGVDGDYADYTRLCFDRDTATLDEAVSRLATAYDDMTNHSSSRQRVLLRP
jgi:DNA-binding transcriptional MocR family regulator